DPVDHATGHPEQRALQLQEDPDAHRLPVQPAPGAEAAQPAHLNASNSFPAAYAIAAAQTLQKTACGQLWIAAIIHCSAGASGGSLSTAGGSLASSASAVAA